jgi:hypothetical protein
VKRVALTRSGSGGERISLTSLRAANRAVKERQIIIKKKKRTEFKVGRGQMPTIQGIALPLRSTMPWAEVDL